MTVRKGIVLTIWLIVLFGTLPGYRHTDVFFVNIPDPQAFWDRLQELAIVLPLAVCLSVWLRRLKIPWLRIEPKHTDTFVWLLAGVTGILLTIYSKILWDAIPKIPDSLVYLFQAKIFAAGRLWALVPIPLKPFDYMFTLAVNGHYISRYSPGFPLFLAAGYRLSAPWIICPFFAGLNVLLLYRLFQRFYHQYLPAAAGAILLVISPLFLGISGQVLSHSPALFCYLIFITAGLNAVQSGRFLWGLSAGAGIGIFFLSRQLSAAVLSIPFLAILGFQTWKYRRWRAAVGFTLAGVAFLALQLTYNGYFTGHPMHFPFHEGKFGALDHLGFNRPVKWDVWPLPGQCNPVHTPLKALKNIHLCWSRVNLCLFGWVSSLFFVPLAFLRKKNPGSIWDACLLAAILLMTVCYSLYWFPGAGLLGARYYYELLPALIFLTIRGAQAVSLELKYIWKSNLTVFPVAFMLICTATGSIWFWPDYIEKTWSAFADDAGSALEQAEANMDPPALAFISGDTTTFSAGFFKNDIMLQGSIIYARDMGPDKNRQLIKKYPNRKPYLYQYGRLHQRLLPLRKNGQIETPDLVGFQSDTAVFDPFDRMDSEKWIALGRAKNIIKTRPGFVAMAGEMPQNMAPGCTADLVYREIPFCNLEVEASFQAPVSHGVTISMALENGRYLDEQQNLVSAIVSCVNPPSPETPYALFHWKGLGSSWQGDALPVMGADSLTVHFMKLKLTTAPATVSAYFDGQFVGETQLKFRSSVLKIRLSGYHDGYKSRSVLILWDSFRLSYPQNDPGNRTLAHKMAFEGKHDSR